MLTVLVILTIIIILFLVGIYQKNTNAICKSRVRLDGKTVIVTGGSTGIGLETAKDLANRGARVIIACPYEDEGNDAIKQIANDTANENVNFKHLDLSSLTSVRSFAREILNNEDRLDVLINNAGVGIVGDYQTADGMHYIMQVNYYGGFLLTLLLLPLLKKTGKADEPSRILLTTSVLHRLGCVDIENMNKTNHWYRVQVYGNSKICLLLFANELTKQLEGFNVIINSVDPGAVGTKIFDSRSKIEGFFLKLFMNNVFKTPLQGAQTTLHAALDRKAATVSGGYFKNCKLTRGVERAYNVETAKSLWEHSLSVVKLTDDELKLCLSTF